MQLRPASVQIGFGHAERLGRRYIAAELILSFMPEPEQRLWRRLARDHQKLAADKVRLQNRLEGLLEEMRTRLSSVASDLLGVSARRILRPRLRGRRTG